MSSGDINVINAWLADHPGRKLRDPQEKYIYPTPEDAELAAEKSKRSEKRKAEKKEARHRQSRIVRLEKQRERMRRLRTLHPWHKQEDIELRRKLSRESFKKWYHNNPDLARARARVTHSKRKAAILGGGGSHTIDDVTRILKLQKYKCAYCRKSVKKKFHVDHIVPLSRGGNDEASNIQITCRTCNSSKHAVDPITFAQRMGMLV